MFLEVYIWCWIHLHPGHVLRKSVQRLGLAALVLVPLFYINIDMGRQGFKPSSPSLQIQTARTEPNY